MSHFSSFGRFSHFLLVLLVLAFLLGLAGCSALRSKPGSGIPNPSKQQQASVAGFEQRMTLLLAGLQPAEIEYTSKVMSDATGKLYVKAVGSYNNAREMMRLYREAIGLGVNDRFTRKRLEQTVKNAEMDSTALQRAREAAREADRRAVGAAGGAGAGGGQAGPVVGPK